MLKVFKTLLRYYWRYKLALIFCVCFIMLTAIFDIGAKVLFKFLVDDFTKQEFSRILILLGLYFALDVLITFAAALGFLFMDSFLIPASRDMRSNVFKHLHDLDISFHENKSSGSLISKIKRGDSTFFAIVHDSFQGILMSCFKFSFLIITVAVIKAEFVIIFLIAFIIEACATYFLLKLNIKTRGEFNNEEDKITHVIVDNLTNFDTVKYFAKEKWEQRRLQKNFQIWSRKLWNYANSFRAIDIVTGVISSLGTTIIIALSFYYGSQKLITLGDMILFITFASTIFPEFNQLIFRLRDIVKNYVDLKEYVSMLDYPIEVKEAAAAPELTKGLGKIEFNNLAFSYKNRDTIFENFNLTIEPGESIALVGESGAGKTTITKLLLRFYDLKQGQILIDDQDISTVSKESLRKSVGIVPQEPILFNDTIAYNLAYGNEAANLEVIKAAVKLANLADFIESLPQKYQTIVGERGIKLSGGQKQRLAIARMFLANPQIIIFDEATSQLDSRSEKLIQEAFWRLAENRTTIIIAHRLSTVMKAKRLVVLDQGKIVQQGTHQELAQAEGIYKTLWDIQRGDFVI
ncbi:MAG: ABC transporter ATP-binding protein [bacterium]